MKECYMTDNKEKIVTIRVPAELHRRAKASLANEGLSFQGLLVQVLQKWTAEHAVKSVAGPRSAQVGRLDRAG